jgi:splicing factor 3A subunit 3
MSSVIEQVRSNHEDIERISRLIVDALNKKTMTKKDVVLRDHAISEGLNCVTNKCDALLDLYEDNSGVLKHEISVLSGKQGEPYTSFYTRLKELKTYHNKHPDIVTVDYIKSLPEPTATTVTFSGEEAYGKHLDLHHIYDLYINIPGVKRVSYLSYLDMFHQFEKLPRSIRTTTAYVHYCKALLGYLEGFYKRSQPLVYWQELVDESSKGFDKAWEDGTVTGWETNPTVVSSTAVGNSISSSSSNTGIDLNTIASVEELLGNHTAETLKLALTTRGLKCGGTVEQRAERLFSVKGLSLEEYPEHILAGSSSKANKRAKKKKRKNKTAATVSEGVTGTKKRSGLKDIAFNEYRISSLVELLMDVILSTKTFTEKKLVRSYEERMAEAREEEEAERIMAADNQDGSDNDEPEETIYNPLNLPLGWDGKPIPFWLYKLHGLSVHYTCEICGNATYRGRRAFDMHFQESRHAHSMRLLGIPNTKHFHDITAIEDALTLYEKLKTQINSEEWDANTQEEYEDSEGNVLSKKMYTDLARQGLL